MFVYEKEGKLNIAFQNTQVPPATPDIQIGKTEENLVQLLMAGQVIEEQDATSYTITVTQPANGNITAPVGGTSFAGVKVALAITPNEGYELDSWAVTKTESGSVVTVSEDNTFEMPSADVTVTATLKESE